MEVGPLRVAARLANGSADLAFSYDQLGPNKEPIGGGAKLPEVWWDVLDLILRHRSLS